MPRFLDKLKLHLIAILECYGNGTRKPDVLDNAIKEGLISGTSKKFPVTGTYIPNPIGLFPPEYNNIYKPGRIVLDENNTGTYN